jgi:hypothetical protein
MIRKLAVLAGSLGLVVGLSLATSAAAGAQVAPSPSPSPSQSGPVNPAMTPLPPSAAAQVELDIESMANFDFVQSHGHDTHVTIENAQYPNLTLYTPKDAQRWNGVDVFQWVGTDGLCLTAAPDNSVRSESCSSHAASTYWYTKGTGTSGEIWFISVYYTDVHGSYGYATEVNPRTGSTVAVYGPGYGLAAVWATP